MHAAQAEINVQRSTEWPTDWTEHTNLLHPWQLCSPASVVVVTEAQIDRERRRKASFCARKRSLVIRPLTHRSMRGPGKTMENQNRKSGLWNTFPFPQIPLIPLLLLCWQRRCWCRSVRTCFSSPRHAATPTPPLSSSLCTYNYKHGAPNTHLISRSWRFTVSS